MKKLLLTIILAGSVGFVCGVMGLYKHYAKISEFINEHIVKYSESEFMIKEVNDKLLANFSQLKTIKSTKYTASTTFTYKNNTFNISLEFGRDDKQTSRIYHDNYFIIIYLNQDRYFKEIDHELRLEFHLSELKEHIAHEVTHLEQFVTGKGYPPRKLREKGVDFDGYPLHKKPSGKVVKRHKREILHGLIDAEFWANLRSLKLTWTAYLQVTPKKERLEMLKELIEEDVTIEEMKSNPEKRRLFIKHLVSNLQDLL